MADKGEVDSPGCCYPVSKNPFNSRAFRRIIWSEILLCSYVSPSRANDSQKHLCGVTIEFMVLSLVTVQDGGRISCTPITLNRSVTPTAHLTNGDLVSTDTVRVSECDHIHSVGGRISKYLFAILFGRIRVGHTNGDSNSPDSHPLY